MGRNPEINRNIHSINRIVEWKQRVSEQKRKIYRRGWGENNAGSTGTGGSGKSAWPGGGKRTSEEIPEKSLVSLCRAINRYELIREGDRIAVCISGGKDSMLMAKLFQCLKRHNKFHFEVVFLVMDPGYSPANRARIEQNAARLGVPVDIFESSIFESVFEVEKSPCYLCARMRRGYLYSRAKELGCNKNCTRTSL